MSLSSRRQFLRQTSLGAAALCGGHASVIAAASRVFQGRAPEVAGTDATSIRKFASQISGHLITPEMPDYESSRLVFNRRNLGTPVSRFSANRSDRDGSSLRQC